MSDKKDSVQNIKSNTTSSFSPDSKQKEVKRSMLHNFATIQWLAKRHNKTTDKRYLFLPEQLQRQEDVEKIFKKIDSDGSGTL